MKSTIPSDNKIANNVTYFRKIIIISIQIKEKNVYLENIIKRLNLEDYLILIIKFILSQHLPVIEFPDSLTKMMR